MKKTLLLIFGWLMLFSFIVQAQTYDSTASRERQQRNRDAFEAAAESTPATRIMHQRFL
jgi:hypothetical protein